MAKKKLFVYSWDGICADSEHPYKEVWMFLAASDQQHAASIAGYKTVSEMRNLRRSINASDTHIALANPGQVLWRERDSSCEIENYNVA